MRRRDRADPEARARQRKANLERSLKAFREWNEANRADGRRAKANLPPVEYEAFVAAAEHRKGQVAELLERAGFTVSRASLQAVIAGLDSELTVIAGLRAGSDSGGEFGEGDVANVFSD